MQSPVECGILQLCCWFWGDECHRNYPGCKTFVRPNMALPAANEIVLTAKGLAGSLSAFEDACRHVRFLPLRPPQQDAEGVNAQVSS